MSQVDLKAGMTVNLVKLTEKDASTSANGTDVMVIANPSTGEMKKITVTNFLSPVANGIGYATTTTMPTAGINGYNLVGGAGTYTNFLTAAATPLVLSSGDVSAAAWQAVKIQGSAYWTKVQVPGVDVSGKADQSEVDALEDLINKLTALTSFISIGPDDTYLFKMKDSANRGILLAKIADGSLQFKANFGGITGDLGGALPTSMSTLSGYLEAHIQKSDSRLVYGIDLNGDLIVRGQNLTNRAVKCWGNSFTQGNIDGTGVRYPIELQRLLGNRYTVTNCGVGGEDVNTISARHGGIPVQLQDAFTLPADGSTVQVWTTTDNKALNKYGRTIKPLLQGDGLSVNPCYIQGIECTLTQVSNVYYLKRNVLSASHVSIPAKSTLYLYGSKSKNAYANLYWNLQNGGYSSDAEAVNYYKDLIRFNGNSNDIVIGEYTGTLSSRASMQLAMFQEFGPNYLDIMTKLIYGGLEDAGITPTSDDLADIAAGKVPRSLLHTDLLHLNQYGLKDVALYIYLHGQQIGIW